MKKIFDFADFSDCIPDHEFTWTEEERKWWKEEETIQSEYIEYLKQIGNEIELKEDDLPY